MYEKEKTYIVIDVLNNISNIVEFICYLRYRNQQVFIFQLNLISYFPLLVNRFLESLDIFDFFKIILEGHFKLISQIENFVVYF